MVNSQSRNLIVSPLNISFSFLETKVHEKNVFPLESRVYLNIVQTFFNTFLLFRMQYGTYVECWIQLMYTMYLCTGVQRNP